MSCPICFEKFLAEPEDKIPYVLQCSHNFHLKCIKSCAEDCGHKCPYCRTEYKDMVAIAKPNLALAAKVESNEQASKPKQIMIRDLDGSTKVIELLLTDSEKKLHDLVSVLTDIPKKELRLTTGTKNIEPEGTRKLFELNIQNNSTVTVLLRMKGGFSSN